MAAWVGQQCVVVASCADPGGGGGTGVQTPLENHKNIGFLINTGLDHLKNHKANKPHSMIGHHRHASETPLNGVSLRAADGQLIVVY